MLGNLAEMNLLIGICGWLLGLIILYWQYRTDNPYADPIEAFIFEMRTWLRLQPTKK